MSLFHRQPLCPIQSVNKFHPIWRNIWHRTFTFQQGFSCKNKKMNVDVSAPYIQIMNVSTIIFWTDIIIHRPRDNKISGVSELVCSGTKNGFTSKLYLAVGNLSRRLYTKATSSTIQFCTIQFYFHMGWDIDSCVLDTPVHCCTFNLVQYNVSKNCQISWNPISVWTIYLTNYKLNWFINV